MHVNKNTWFLMQFTYVFLSFAALSFPQGHQLHVYTLPVGSWREAVLRSYQTALGLLEFVSFLIASQSLATPMKDDKYWVGLFRRHDFKFGLGNNYDLNKSFKPIQCQVCLAITRLIFRIW